MVSIMHVHTPNENREVVLYDHFAGDNSSSGRPGARNL